MAAAQARSSPFLLHHNQQPHSDSSTPAVEVEHVHRVYDRIARSWHGTRYKAWPRVEAFARSLPRCSLIADVGAGNGKNLPACTWTGEGDQAGLSMPIASDISLELAKIVAERGFEVLGADVTCLPFRDGVFDALLCIAVLHHLSTDARRAHACAECCRILRPGGRAVFYAWAQEQAHSDLDGETSARAQTDVPPTTDGRPPEAPAMGGYSGHRFAAQDVLVPFHVPLWCVDDPAIHELALLQQQTDADAKGGGAAMQPPKGCSSAVMPPETHAGGEEAPPAASADSQSEHWRYDAAKRSVVFQRYCHVYCRGELELLFEPLVAANLVAIEDSWYDCGNWCALVVRQPAEGS